MLYLLSRIIIGSVDNLSVKGKIAKIDYFPVLAAFVWGIVMFLFEDDKGYITYKHIQNNV